MSERLALAWLRKARHYPMEECECESGTYGPDGSPEYGGYDCGCGPERKARAERIKRNRAQLRRYIDRLLAGEPSNGGAPPAESGTPHQRNAGDHIVCPDCEVESGTEVEP